MECTVKWAPIWQVPLCKCSAFVAKNFRRRWNRFSEQSVQMLKIWRGKFFIDLFGFWNTCQKLAFFSHWQWPCLHGLVTQFIWQTWISKLKEKVQKVFLHMTYVYAFQAVRSTKLFRHFSKMKSATAVAREKVKLDTFINNGRHVLSCSKL